MKTRATSIGLYVFGATEVSQEAIDIPSRLRALSEKDLPSLKERANIIKSQGAKALIQIDHRGCFKILNILVYLLLPLLQKLQMKN